MFQRVLIVCTGNVCRSPMAEAVLAHRLRERGFSVTVESAGVGALVGRPAEREALELMQERGLDIARHRARQLTPELIRPFELILVMDSSHQGAVEAMMPSARGRVHRLGRFGEFDVPDPFRQGRAAFERSLTFIDRGVADFENAFWSKRR